MDSAYISTAQGDSEDLDMFRTSMGLPSFVASSRSHGKNNPVNMALDAAKMRNSTREWLPSGKLNCYITIEAMAQSKW